MCRGRAALVFCGPWRRATMNIWRQISSGFHVVFNPFRGTLPVSNSYRFSSGTRRMPGDGLSEGSPAKVPKIVHDKNEEDRVTLRFSKLTENAFAPTRGSSGAAGYDLYSAYNYTVPAQGKMIALTDLQIALPDGCYGRVAPRSGLAAKHFIDVGAGVVDQDYRGNVGVVLFNFGQNDFEVKKGDRVAQLILERIFIPDLLEVPTLDCTTRGSGGFGSTG